jgi:fructokinase
MTMSAPTAQQLPRFVSAGEALTDMIRAADGSWVSKLGGATWNVARVVEKLGIHSAFAGAISCDVFGDALWEASAQSGLDLRFIQRQNKSPLLAFVPETHPPRYFFVGDDSADLHFDATLLPQGWRQAVQWAHFGGISLAREPLAGNLLVLATDLKAAGVKISYDPNFRVMMDARYDATLRRMSELADVIKVSDEDLVGLFRSDEVEKSLTVIRQWNPQAVILYTRGAAGASLYAGQQTWRVASPEIKVVDTVGAGDASIGGLLFSLMQYPNRDWSSHLRFAVCSGASACLAAGAAPPSLQSILELLAA